jgi:Plasmid encoded RepA protein
VTWGVPYGARARMILLYLQTQAVRTGRREIELGRSMRDWMERMGLSIGGETARSLREQAARISACTLWR